MGKLNLSIYLVKEEIIDFNDVQEKGIELIRYNDDKVLYYGPSNIINPKWMKDFFNCIDENVKTSNARALLLRKLQTNDGKNRIFALAFGYGKSFFKEDVIEEQFGLKIVLNTLERNKIRRISKVDIGKNYKQSQEQLPKENDISEFGFDIDRDLIKFVSGKSDDEYLDKSMLTGGDVLSLTVENNIENIDDLLLYVYDKYTSEDYKIKYPWLDNIKQIKEKKLIDNLNSCVVNYLNNKKFDDIWLAIPELVNWEKIRCIKIQGFKEEYEYTDIDMECFINSFANKQIGNINHIKNKKIYLYSSETEDVIKSWSAFKCLVGSIEYNGNVYSINDGVWYKIDKNFEMEVNKAYENLEISNINFIDCNENMDEDQYNQHLCNYLGGSKLLHKKEIPIGGGKGNKIEPCDIIYNNNFIHIKASAGSSSLSHLFNQATVSCTLFKDPNFRNKFNEKMANENINYHLNDNFIPENHNVILGIITKNGDGNSLPKIPFFSKVTIKYAREIIERNLGYNMKIKNIRKVDKK